MYKTILDILHQAERQHADKIAVKEQNFCLSYKQLCVLSYTAAKALLATGISKGDRIAIWAPNIYEWIIAALGTHLLGAILVPINTRWNGSEAAYVLEHSGAKLLFTLSDFTLGKNQSLNYLEMLQTQALPHLQESIVLRGTSTHAIGWHEFLVRAESISDQVLSAHMDKVQAEDTMDMLFTSGTTGKPKGVLCAHEQNIRTVSTWADTVGLCTNDNYLIINPFFHSFGYKAGWLAALIKGATILPVLSFNAEAVLAQIESDKVSVLPGPPTVYQSLLACAERAHYDLSSLRLAVTGAATVPVALIADMRQQLCFQTVLTAYGLTESCGFVSICRPEDSIELISQTSGRAMQGVEVKCVNTQGDEVATGTAGEIWVRGYNVMQGYFADAAATKAAVSEDGWLKTGDIGVINGQGYLTITDRLKDMYICGGFNVYPAEIENMLSSLQDVQQVAVIGVADPRMGEVGKAYIVASKNSTLTEEAVLNYSKKSLANYKIPRFVEFIDAMPTNASGKVLKTVLRQWSQ